MAETQRFRRGDNVVIGGYDSVTGRVIRSAKDGSWVDVEWTAPSGKVWRKRQPDSSFLRLVRRERAS